ncbi:CDP-glycerol glycerophosphotransferase family protein [Pueribacillus theae]|nr:CDP-glycerol glycerophosphotransferase family protein [Pueribacillus theae]
MKENKGEFFIFLITLPLSEHKELISGRKKIWDAYVIRNGNDVTKRARIKTSNLYLRFLSIVLPNERKMFYPFSTKNEKLSFNCNDYSLFANFEEVNISGEEVTFTGHFNYPPMFHEDGYQILNTKVVITNNLDDSLIELPVEKVERLDLYQKYKGNELLKQSGFKGVLKIDINGTYEQKKYYKFYLELTYEENGVTKTIRSSRMRWIQDKSESKRRIIRTKSGKIKVKVKPTKKSKFLSLQVSDYEFKKEFVENLKTSWVKFRRGKLARNVYKHLFQVFGKLPAKNNLIVFESFLGKQFSDSPRAIYEYLKEHQLDYEMYWSADRRHVNYFKNIDVKYARRFSLKWLILMSRAKYLVSNSRLPLWLPKPKDTIYLQTWHGTPLKRLAADMDEVHMPGTNTERYKNNFLKEASKWDYLVSPNAYSSEIFRRAFCFEKTMIESGYPRNDFLINHNDKKTIVQLKEACHLPTDKKVILYAPTWRDNQFYKKGKYKFDLQLDLEKLKEELGEEYIIVLRLHYLVAENLDLTGYENFVFDLSHHEDIRELYLIADMLITDYSSVFFDYANLKRPMFFFVYDIEDYRDNLRGFYFDFEKQAPGPLVKTTEELINEIKNIDRNGFTPSETIEAFYKKFCYLEDGRASERVVKEVFQQPNH